MIDQVLTAIIYIVYFFLPGYMILGLGLVSVTGLTASIVHLFNHALMKGALFLVLGAIFYRIGSCNIDRMAGLTRQMPWTMAAFALASLSVVGIPPTSGFVSKWYLVLGTVDRYRDVGSADHYSLMLLGVLLVSSLLNAIYLGPIVYKAYFERGAESDEDEQVREVPWMVAPLVITAVASLLLGIFPGPVLSLAGSVVP